MGEVFFIQEFVQGELCSQRLFTFEISLNKVCTPSNLHFLLHLCTLFRTAAPDGLYNQSNRTPKSLIRI